MNRRARTMSLTFIRFDQLEHALQCAQPAESEGAGDEPLSTVDHRLERAGRCARAQ
jgi:predicted HD phosphohydrolase